VRLTLAGDVLLKYAEEMIRLMHAARDELGDIQAQGRGRLAIGASPSLATHVLPQLLETYRQRYPHVYLLLEAGWPPEILRRIQVGELDLGVVVLVSPGLDPSSPLICEPLTTEELVFVRSATGPVVRQQRVTVDDLQEVPWILNHRGCQYRGSLERQFTERGLTMQVAVEVLGEEAHKKLVQLGLGVALLPQPLVAEEVRNGSLKVFTVEGVQLHSHSCLLYRRDKYIHRAMQGCLDLVREAFRRTSPIPC